MLLLVYKMAKKTDTYQLLVYIAYGFFLLLGLAWLVAGFVTKPAHINPVALGVVLVFGAQCYYRHLLANLIIGLLCIFLSLFMMLLPALNMLAQPNKETAAYAIPIVIISVLAVVLSGIMVFSYMKLSFKDE